MNRHAAIALFSLPLIAACADEATRRDYIYKPAYCLASGLAALNNEACMPQSLKDDAKAVAVAKAAEPAAPAVAKHVYYTEDQRIAMGTTIAQAMFAPNEKLTRSSVAVSLEANDLLPVADKKICGRAAMRDEVIDGVMPQVTDKTINRETAKFLSEHYSDLQLSELYRAAKAGGGLDTVANDAFIIPDPKDPKKNVNIKPQSGRGMGSILSYTTSRAVSQTIKSNRKAIEAHAVSATAKQDAACAPKPAELPAPAPTQEAPKAEQPAAPVAATTTAAPAAAPNAPAAPAAEGASQ